MKLAKLKTCEYFRGWHVMGMWPDLIMWGWSHVKTDEMGVGVYSFVFHCVHVFWGLDRSHNDLLWSLLWCHGQRLCRAVCWLHGCQNDSESSTIHSLSSLTPKLKAGEGPERGYSSLSSELGLSSLLFFISSSSCSAVHSFREILTESGTIWWHVCCVWPKDSIAHCWQSGANRKDIQIILQSLVSLLPKFVFVMLEGLF